MATSACSSSPAMRFLVRTQNRISHHRRRNPILFYIFFGSILLCIFFIFSGLQNQNSISAFNDGSLRSPKSSSEYDGESFHSSIRLFQGHPRHNAQDINRMKAMAVDSYGIRIVLEISTLEQQRDFLAKHGEECYPMDKHAVLRRYDELDAGTQSHYRHELWKYCALALHGGAYIDNESPLLKTFLDAFPNQNKNYAVLGSTFEGTIHGSIVILSESKSPIALGMVKTIVETGGIELDLNPLFLQKELYELISADLNLNPIALSLKPGIHVGKTNEWIILEQKCAFNHELTNSNTLATQLRIPFECPASDGYCCEILHPSDFSVLMITRYTTLPSQYLLPMSSLQKPYSGQMQSSSQNEMISNPDLPFISTIKETIFEPSEELLQGKVSTPNFYEILLEKNCLPADKECSSCLRNKAGANCKICQKECKCFCNTLCSVTPEEKFVRKHLYVTLPPYRKDPSRIIPRIVHQTWFEHVTLDKYPNMSRLTESWKQSGWEYKFYDDDAISEFLSVHFPPEVKEAYDAIIPGAFKADLFRYCALLIYGGVYADMDVMLESNLDATISGDIGFMVPMDEPGTPVDQRMCLWNGFIASAPGHPFLARVIETVVNNVRNRFTSVDVDSLLCPNPELSISHAFDTLFTAGPCMLGSAVNFVLRKHLQTPYEPGDLDIHDEGSETDVNPLVLKASDVRSQIPGRTIILNQNKEDMGAHRFTWLEKNLVVAGTDFPDYDDRENLEDGSERTHYSKTHVRIGIYGLENLYTDNFLANEEIRIIVNSQNEFVDTK